jgi:hypothetical protein
MSQPPSKNPTKDLKKNYDHDAGYYEYDEVYLTSNVRGRGGRRSRAANKDKEGLNVYSSRHVRLKLERKQHRGLAIERNEEIRRGDTRQKKIG